jgi:aldose 1-epimerase
VEAEDIASPVMLAAGPLTAQIVGGDFLTVTSLQYRDVELLVDPGELATDYRVHNARAGITLLHPWANRLGADDFEFAGRHGHLNGDGERIVRDAHGLAIHGLSAPCPWRPVRLGAADAVASLTWLEEPGFPFAHQIVVRFGLSVGGDHGATLTVSTSVTALTGGPVPVALGWHPYFRRSPAGEIELPALRQLAADAQGLPVDDGVPREPTRIALAGLEGAGLDYGVGGLARGSAMTLQNPGHTISVDFVEGYPWGQVFAPSDAPVVSLEPMTAPTDALRRGHDLPVSRLERPYTATFAVRVEAPVTAPVP